MNGGDCYHSPDVLDIIFSLNSDADIITGTHSENGIRNVGKDGVTMLDLYKWAIDHQASFIRRDVALRHPYDEKYRIVSDWKFCLEAMIIDNCSFRNIDIVIADYDTSGISTNSNGLLPKEKEIIKKEVFPPRIISDYQRFAPVDDELLDLSLLLTQTVKARKAAKIIIKFLLLFTNKNK
jgi:hypothetical protein